MYDMTIRLQSGGEKTLYEQIYDHIREEIREGKLLQGERLPSTRSLAEFLQVSRSTVDYAYGQLLSEGYIEARPCKGYYVCRMEELYSLERGLCGASVPGRVPEKEQEQDFAYDFSPNGIDMSGFPFGVWKKITKNILSDSNSSLFALGEAQGDYDLRLTISRYLHSSRGVNCTPEQIIVGAGNDYLLLLLEKILGPGRRIAMENPTYKRAYRIFRSVGYQIEAVDVDEGGMSVGKLKASRASVAYVMPSHQFPTGAVMPIGRRSELLGWADREEERYLIEDDYDSEFRYRGKPIPSLQASDQHGRVIYIGTFSKAIAPAIRVSYMVLPEKLLLCYRQKCYFYSSTVSRIDQRILNEFIRDGYFERHLNKMRKCYKVKHDLLLTLLEPFSGHFSVTGENAGLHMLLTAADERTEEELLTQAKNAGVKVYGLSESRIVEDGEQERALGEGAGTGEGAGQGNAQQRLPGTVILGYGGLTPEQMYQGIERLKKAWLKE